MSEAGSRLLIADDNKVNRLLLSRSVELLGYAAVLADNGRAALKKLRTEPFELLLLDIEMPVMNGFEVLEELNKDVNLRDLPVIVTSSVEGLDNIARCISLGAEDYLPKPVNQILLKARIDACLEKKRLRDQQKELVRRLVSPEVIEDLRQSDFALGGRRAHLSVMFSDIRGFTALAEKQEPEETFDLLNTYYLLMFDAIVGCGGCVNQIMGDGLLALFGAPLPLEESAASAVGAASEMMIIIEQFNMQREAENKPPLRIGVGIATGDVVAGYTGTQQRGTYTCVGDTVNLAARLEAHTKETGRSILIDGATRNALPGGVPVESLGPVRLRGRAAAVEVYAVGAG